VGANGNYYKILQNTLYLLNTSYCYWTRPIVTGWRRLTDPLCLYGIFRKRALYLVALLWKMICNLGDPMSLRHPVLNTSYCYWTRPIVQLGANGNDVQILQNTYFIYLLPLAPNACLSVSACFPLFIVQHILYIAQHILYIAQHIFYTPNACLSVSACCPLFIVQHIVCIAQHILCRVKIHPMSYCCWHPMSICASLPLFIVQHILYIAEHILHIVKNIL